jgi:hypothetical protein
MPESNTHKVFKTLVCFPQKPEKRLPSGKLIDCLKEDEKFCAEVELHRSRISKAIERLNEATDVGMCHQQVLVVKDEDIEYANRLTADKQIEVISKREFLSKLGSEDKNR